MKRQHRPGTGNRPATQGRAGRLELDKLRQASCFKEDFEIAALHSRCKTPTATASRGPHMGKGLQRSKSAAGQSLSRPASAAGHEHSHASQSLSRSMVRLPPVPGTPPSTGLFNTKCHETSSSGTRSPVGRTPPMPAVVIERVASKLIEFNEYFTSDCDTRDAKTNYSKTLKRRLGEPPSMASQKGLLSLPSLPDAACVTPSTPSWDGEDTAMVRTPSTPSCSDGEKHAAQENNGKCNNPKVEALAGNSGNGGGEEETLPDVSFVVTGAPTLKEVLQRFDGLSDSEQERVQRVSSRFTCEEGALHKDLLGLVLSHLGYIVESEEKMHAMAIDVNSVSSSLDVVDLNNFVHACAMSQKQTFASVFYKYAVAEGSTIGTVSVDEIPMVMMDLNIILLRSNIQELLTRAGLIGSTRVDCNGMARILAAYRVCEGFTVKQLTDAQQSFETASNGHLLAIADLPNTLLEFFGVHHVKHLRALVKNSEVALMSSGLHQQPVSFYEFLIWARHLQTADLVELHEAFELVDDDKNGAISFEQLMTVMEKQGFTICCPEADEFLRTAGLPAGRDKLFSFDEVYGYFVACRESEGFCRQDLDELIAVYNKFDTEGEGEITILQVLDLLRSLGYHVLVEDVERYAKDVDFNGNGTMDVNEFLRLMRLHRQDELINMHKVYYSRVDSETGGLPFDCLYEALSVCCSSQSHIIGQLITCSSKSRHESQSAEDESTADLSFDVFKILADKGRKSVKASQRKQANFSDAEVEILQGAFAAHDVQGKGVLDMTQMFELLRSSGVQVREIAKVGGVENIDKARKAALCAEISSAEVGQRGSHSITFWTMVHAWRMIARENERKNFDGVERTRVYLSLSAAEIEEFQKVFSEWAKRTPDSESPDGLADVNYLALQSVLCSVNEQLSFQSFKGLLGSLGVRVGAHHITQLSKEMQRCTGQHEGPLDFVHFLRIMRWMLDTNFAHVNDRAVSKSRFV